MILHENVNLAENDYFTIMTETNLNFKTHFHNAIELCYLINGQAEFYIDGKLYTAKSNECVIIMPDQIHSIITPVSSKIKIIRFRPELTGSFHSAFLNKVPENAKFTVRSCLNITEEHIEIKNIYTVKGIVYMLLSDLCSQCKKWEQRHIGGSIVEQMLDIIDKDFSSDISLKNIAVRLNYNPAYLSRKFYETMGMSFNDYLNNCRINYSCLLLEKPSLSITEIAHASGFNSIRSFNRNFMKYIGITPGKYRASASI